VISTRFGYLRNANDPDSHTYGRIPILADEEEVNVNRAPGQNAPENRNEPRRPGLSGIFNSGRFKFSIWYAVIAVMLIVAIQQFTNTPVQVLTYSEFLRVVEDGKVGSLAIGEGQIEGRYITQPDSLPGTDQFRVVRVEDHDELINMLDERGIQYYGVVPSPWPKILSWILPMLVLVGVWFVVLRRMGGPAGGMMSVGKSKAKIYVEDETKVTFEDIAGIEEAEEEVREIVDFLKEPEKFQRLGGRIPKGALLVGPPGTGKTLLARAVAGEAGVPFFSLSGSDFVEMFVGVGASRVRDLFQQAKEKAPCIVFIDELDALGKSRGGNPMGSHDEREQTLNQLLVEMDGFEANANVIIVAATNRPETLDIALLRPGRFDRQIVVDRPDVNGREAILQVHAKAVKLEEDVNLRTLAARTPGMVGADLANVINEAALLAARKGHENVRMTDLEEAVDRVTGGLERKSRVLNNQEREITAYHEAGHAVVAECLEYADAVHRVSIIPRGVTSLGQTMYLPTGDRYLMATEELEDRLAVALGGRVAEELIFDEITTSAGQDFRRATQIAEHMVKDYGMSRLGLVAYGEQTSVTQQQMPGASFAYSDETSAEIDNEVRRIITENYDRVRSLLDKHRDGLRAIADALISSEHLTGDTVRQLIADPDGPVPEELMRSAEAAMVEADRAKNEDTADISSDDPPEEQASEPADDSVSTEELTDNTEQEESTEDQDGV
jgi:cell division protease FtsH